MIIGYKNSKLLMKQNLVLKDLLIEVFAKIPFLFHHPPEKFSKATKSANTHYTIPVIDFSNIGNNPNTKA
jgi:hypothetical protein